MADAMPKADITLEDCTPVDIAMMVDENEEGSR
jgi:hypothetical protein